MSDQNPIDQFAAQVDDVRREVSSLEGAIRLTQINDQLENLATLMQQLPQRAKDLRARGYAFEKGMVDMASDMAAHWNEISPGIHARVDQECYQMSSAMRSIEDELSRLMPLSRSPESGRMLLDRIRGDMSVLQNRVTAAQNNINGMYDEFLKRVNWMDKHLKDLEWTIEQVDRASFRLLENEWAVLAVKATWYRDGKEDRDDPKGTLFLTDQRLIFEQNEDVATKKVLFITTEKKHVQQALVNIPTSQVDEVKSYQKGLFKNEDNLEIHFKPGAQVDAAFFHIFDQESDSWLHLINMVRDGMINETRAFSLSQASVEKVKAAPTVCPNCSGALTQPVLRGMDSITCPYCGTVTRI